jgi:protein-L-isoaspartate O-methyltransferase
LSGEGEATAAAFSGSGGACAFSDARGWLSSMVMSLTLLLRSVVVGDGTAGCSRRAPFDAIVVSAAFTNVPEPFVAQLLDGGRLVQPMGPGGRDEVTLTEKRGGAIERRAMITPARFVKLYGDHGFTLEG